MFLVNTVALVEQQASVLERHLVVDKVGQYSGEMNLDFWDKKVWDEEFSKYKVYLTSHQCYEKMGRTVSFSFPNGLFSSDHGNDC